MAKWLLNGKKLDKVSHSWCLVYRLERLRDLLLSHPTISFQHVKREAYKTADWLVNVGVESRIGFRCDRLEYFGEEEWDQQCRHLASKDVTTLLDFDPKSDDFFRRRMDFFF